MTSTAGMGSGACFGSRGGRGERPMPEYHLFKDLIYPFMRASRQWKKPSTLRVQASDVRPLERILRGYYVTYQPRDLCQHRLIVTGEAVAHYRERRKIEGVQPVTIARELSLASAACKYAISELCLDIPNPFAGRLISRVDRRTVQPRKRVMRDSEENSLLIALEQPARDMLLLYLETGMRVNELRLLTRDRCDLDEGVIAFSPDNHKSGTYAAIALTDEAKTIISRQVIVDTSPFVFNVRKAGVSESWWRRQWTRARKIAGCVDLQARDLRRTALTRWRHKFGIEATQAQARHSNRKTTEQIYARSTVEIALEAIKSARVP
jgi:integrase